MRRQAEALMAEKARIQAENYALLKEKTNLLERLEYMEQVRGRWRSVVVAQLVVVFGPGRVVPLPLLVVSSVRVWKREKLVG